MKSTLSYQHWMILAEDEYGRLDDLIGSLTSSQLERPTDCAGWDVRAVLSHVAGGAAAMGRVRDAIRQLREGRRLMPRAHLVETVNAAQVAERRDLTLDQLGDDLRSAAARGLKRRRGLPAPLRVLPVPVGPPPGTVSLDRLLGCILTRDAWMHRIDVCRATDQAPQLTADHDGMIVADLVAEWSRVHGQPFALDLAGPAGGSWRRGVNGERIDLDAVEFGRAVSGRETGTGLMEHQVPF